MQIVLKRFGNRVPIYFLVKNSPVTPFRHAEAPRKGYTMQYTEIIYNKKSNTKL